MIYAFIGPKQSGKSTACAYIESKLPDTVRINFKDALIQGFKEVFAISLTPGSLKDWEKKEAVKLAHDKYSSDQWNMKGQL